MNDYSSIKPIIIKQLSKKNAFCIQMMIDNSFRGKKELKKKVHYKKGRIVKLKRWREKNTSNPTL